MRNVRFYFDFVSPYSWLALSAAADFAKHNDVRWDLRPVVYAKLLEAEGLVGPGETDRKRNYTFHDIARCAALQGLRFEGPPSHPFRSLEALRVATLFREDPRALVLCGTLAEACWSEGRDLTRIDVLEEIVAAAGFDVAGIADRITSPEIKGELRDTTTEAVELGLFGVPSFLLGAELFWGHDRMGHLADRIRGRLASTEAGARRMLTRPIGVRRRRGDRL